MTPSIKTMPFVIYINLYYVFYQPPPGSTIMCWTVGFKSFVLGFSLIESVLMNNVAAINSAGRIVIIFSLFHLFPKTIIPIIQIKPKCIFGKFE